MFERYILVPGSLRNTVWDGVEGFELQVRLAYYRGLALSMVEGFELTVDGEIFEPADLRFRTDAEIFSFASMETEVEARWEFDAAATLFAPKPGGLPAGAHEVSVVEILRISYMPQPARRQDAKTFEIA